jgi:hypothetical protein
VPKENFAYNKYITLSNLIFRKKKEKEDVNQSRG